MLCCYAAAAAVSDVCNWKSGKTRALEELTAKLNQVSRQSGEGLRARVNTDQSLSQTYSCFHKTTNIVYAFLKQL